MSSKDHRMRETIHPEDGTTNSSTCKQIFLKSGWLTEMKEDQNLTSNFAIQSHLIFSGGRY